MTQRLPTLVASGVSKYADSNFVCCFDAKNGISLSIFSTLSDLVACAISLKSSSVVGICLHQTCLIPVVLVGILKAEKAFCCFNRLDDKQLVESCFVSYVVTDDERLFSPYFCNVKQLVIPELSPFGKLFIGKLQQHNAMPSIVDTALGRGEIAYVAFTSGSTGRPKPVFVSHNSIVPNVLDFNHIWKINHNDVIALMSPLTFDPSFIEIFCSLSSGAALSVISPEVRLNASILASTLLENGVTIIQITPSMFGLFSLSDLELLLCSPRSKLRVISFGGEHFPFRTAASVPLVLRKWLLLDKKNRIFILYGVTEVSCWCNVAEISHESLNFNCQFPDVGPAMTDSTVLSVLPTTSLPNLRVRELAISTRNRRCYVGSELLSTETDSSELFVRRTGDLVIALKAGGFKIVGRVDDFVKRFGQKVNTHLLEESVLSFLKGTASRVVAVVQKQKRTKLNLCIFVTSEQESQPSVSDIRNFIRNKLSDVYLPDQIHLTSLSVPLTRHGKVSKSVVASFFEHGDLSVEFVNRPLGTILDELWLEITGKTPTPASRFTEDGGNSIGVIRICETIRQAAPHASLVKLADLLLTKTFHEAEAYLRDENKLPDNSDISTKMITSLVSETSDAVSFGIVARATNIVGNVPKLLNFHENSPLSSKTCLIKEKWKSYFEKCIDGSPILKINPSSQHRVYIASHSGLVRCLNLQDGGLVWEFRASGRIEGSLMLSKCGNYVIFGTYNNFIYVLEEESGKVHLEKTTGDIVKSTPTVDYNGNGYVYIGCHDGVVYVIDTTAGTLVAQIDCKSGAVLASPLISAKIVVICTLQGKVVCLEKISLGVKWKFDGRSPIFSTPVEIGSERIVIAAVNSDIFSLNENTGEVIWQLEKVSGNIFAPLTRFDSDVVLVASHSAEAGSLVCLNCQSGTITWLVKLPMSVTSAPFVTEGVIFVFDTKGGCHLLRTKDGSLVCPSPTIQLPGDVFSSPVVFDNCLYIGCRNDYFYCLKIELNN